MPANSLYRGPAVLGQNLGVAGTGSARPLPASGVPDYWIVLLAMLDIELCVPPVV